jgi:hypothetical protein
LFPSPPRRYHREVTFHRCARAAIAAIVAVAAMVSPALRQARQDAPSREPHLVAIEQLVSLPADLDWPGDDGLKPVVDAIAADIDDDGDLDVVANQGSLQLAVWVNDGSGRLTRAPGEPQQHSTLRPSGAAVESRGGGPATAMSIGSISIVAAEHATAYALDASPLSTGPPRPHRVSSHSSPSAPRAPPLPERV